MANNETHILSGQVVEEELVLTLEELSCACAEERGRIVELIEHGLLEARAHGGERFGGDALRRARVAVRLQRDLGVNAAGAVLVIELLERIEALEQRLRNR